MTYASAVAEPKTIEGVLKDRTYTSDPSELVLLTEFLNRCADRIERLWESMPNEEHRYWRRVAHDMLRPRSKFRKLRIGIQLSFLAAKAGSDTIASFFAATQRFHDALLDAIEREHPDYVRDVVRGLEELKGDSARPPMTAEEFGDWLANISHSPVRKV